MDVLEQNFGFTQFTLTRQKSTSFDNIFPKSYLRFGGRLTSPVTISMSTNFVISIADCSGHLSENIKRYILHDDANVFAYNIKMRGIGKHWKLPLPPFDLQVYCRISAMRHFGLSTGDDGIVALDKEL